MAKAADFAERAAQDLPATGVRPGGVLLAHSSLIALGHVPGGPETVVQLGVTRSTAADIQG